MAKDGHVIINRDKKTKNPMNTIDMVQLYHPCGGHRPYEIKQETKYFDSSAVAIVRFKSMVELMKEFPNFYFDVHGNFNNGRVTDRGYHHDHDSIYDHLAPSYFSRMGHTLHVLYNREEGIRDTWYYTVIDR